MVSVVLFIVGFAVLIYGANLLVNSSTSLARRLNIPNIVIGLTIVAFGTSAPELIVNILASVKHNTDLVLGNVIGSNIFNIYIILGFSALFYPLSVKTNTTWFEIPLNFLAASIVLLLASDVFLDHANENLLSRADGIVCIFFFLIFLVYNIQLMKSGSYEEEIPTKNYGPAKSVVFLIGGFGLLFLGGRLIVDNAVNLAQDIGVSERVISLTIVSVGTSLPELATSIVAARKHNVDLAIGNIVGSNIFNIFLILGVSATIHPARVQIPSFIDMFMNILAALLLFTFVFTGRGRRIENWEGAIFILIYSGYMYYLFR
jgi:cation:H+ antiporter